MTRRNTVGKELPRPCRRRLKKQKNPVGFGTFFTRSSSKEGSGCYREVLLLYKEKKPGPFLRVEVKMSAIVYLLVALVGLLFGAMSLASWKN
jgi:hypothetical protein